MQLNTKKGGFIELMKSLDLLLVNNQNEVTKAGRDIIEYSKMNRPHNIQVIRAEFKDPDYVIMLYDNLTKLAGQMSVEEHGGTLFMLVYLLVSLAIKGKMDVVLTLLENLGSTANIVLSHGELVNIETIVTIGHPDELH